MLTRIMLLVAVGALGLIAVAADAPSDSSSETQYEVRILSLSQEPFEGVIASGYRHSPRMESISGTSVSQMVDKTAFAVMVSGREKTSVRVEVFDGKAVVASASGPRVASGIGIPPGTTLHAVAF